MILLRNLLFLLCLAMTVALRQINLRHFSFGSRKHVRHNRSVLFLSTEIQKTLASGSYEAEMEVKKSRFIGYAQHVQSWDEAKDYIEGIKNEHPKARHWCVGFRCGVNPVNERCSDDGEPTGTAGVPILGAIKGENLSDTVCVVVRYFGGVKLGAGGLIRAYGGAARNVLREAPVEIIIPKSTFRLSVDATYIGTVYDTIAQVGGTASGEEYGDDGSLTVTALCETSCVDKFLKGLQDGTKGSVIFLQDDDNESEQ